MKSSRGTNWSCPHLHFKPPKLCVALWIPDREAESLLEIPPVTAPHTAIRSAIKSGAQK
jgi:hypothetical protein